MSQKEKKSPRSNFEDGLTKINKSSALLSGDVISEWYLTVDISTGAEIKTVTGLKSGSIFTTDPITKVVDYADEAEVQPQTIQCICRT